MVDAVFTSHHLINEYTACFSCLVPEQNQFVYYVTWLGFVCGIFAVSLVVFAMVVRAFLSSSLPLQDTSHVDDGRVRTVQIRAAFCVQLAAGVAWISGVLLLRDRRIAYEVVFCIANAFLGFSVLLFYCLLYDMYVGTRRCYLCV